MLAFSIRNAAKDVGYYSQMAKDAGVQSLMSESPLNALNAATDEGQGDQMVSQMVDFYAKKFSRK
jgi:3-hydroxyisobutyrate dehydrogenase-like beta-hydroxyacid dehydrogenase